jgi:hypothetical protein
VGADADGYVYFNNDGHGCAVRDAVVFARFAARVGLPTGRHAELPETPVG